MGPLLSGAWRRTLGLLVLASLLVAALNALPSDAQPPGDTPRHPSVIEGVDPYSDLGILLELMPHVVLSRYEYACVAEGVASYIEDALLREGRGSLIALGLAFTLRSYADLVRGADPERGGPALVDSLKTSILKVSLEEFRAWAYSGFPEKRIAIHITSACPGIDPGSATRTMYFSHYSTALLSIALAVPTGYSMDEWMFPLLEGLIMALGEGGFNATSPPVDIGLLVERETPQWTEAPLADDRPPLRPSPGRGITGVAPGEGGVRELIETVSESVRSFVESRSVGAAPGTYTNPDLAINVSVAEVASLAPIIQAYLSGSSSALARAMAEVSVGLLESLAPLVRLAPSVSPPGSGEAPLIIVALLAASASLAGAYYYRGRLLAPLRSLGAGRDLYGGRGALEACYSEVLEELSGSVSPRRPHETPREYVSRIKAALDGGVWEALWEATMAFEKVYYGGGEPSAWDLQVCGDVREGVRRGLQ